jgi:hypothetical protein
VADSLDNLGSVVGLSRASMREIWDEVKANNAMLNACPRHDFECEDPARISAKWRCMGCGGHVSANAAHWYNLGRSHG